MSTIHELCRTSCSFSNHMTITPHGEGCFRMQSGDFSLVLDPSSERFKANITLRTLIPLGTMSRGGTESLTSGPLHPGDPHELTTAGEYEIQGVSIKGFQLPPQERELRTAYTVEWEEMRLGFLGHASEMLDPEALEQFADVDILFVPLDAPYLSGENAAKIVKQVEPHIVIPVFTKNPKALLKELGQSAEPIEKLTIKKKELGAGIKVVWLKE